MSKFIFDMNPETESILIQTPDGKKVELNDQGNNIVVVDQSGNEIEIDTNSDDMNISINNNINESASNDINSDAGNNINITAGATVNVTAPTINCDGVTNIGHGGPAIARVGDAIQVAIMSGSSAGTYIGEIIEGADNSFAG